MTDVSRNPGHATLLTETDIPARLDRLQWGRFHTLVVTAPGITWILDGLEVALAGSLYVLGAVGGAIVVGWMTERWGRRRLFNITIGLYLLATALTAFSNSFATSAFFGMLTGAGIGGEYAAISSAIQELISARYRGRTDLIANGSF